MEGQERSTNVSVHVIGDCENGRGGWAASLIAKTRPPFLVYWAFNNYLLVKIMSHTKEFEFFRR